jgi:hypothetical protein
LFAKPHGETSPPCPLEGTLLINFDEGGKVPALFTAP